MKRSLWVVTLLALLIAQGAVAGDGKALFEFESGKPVDKVIVAEDAGIVLMTSERELAAYKLEDGSRTLTAEGKFASDLFTAFCGGKQVVVAADKGKELVGYDVMTGAELWRGAPPMKLKKNDMNGVYDTPAGLLLHVRNELACIDPATGVVLWTKEGLNLSPAELRDAIYAVKGDFGVRLIGLGAPMSHAIHVLDGATGEVLNTLPYDLFMARKPVLRITDSRVVILHKDGAVAIDAASGDELWNLEAKLNGSEILKKFKVDGVPYAFFGMTESLAVVNLETGDLAYRSGEDINMRLIEAELEDGILVVVGVRDQSKKKADEINSAGGFLIAYGVNPAEGSLAWGPTVFAGSAVLSLAETGKALGKLGAFAQMAQGNVAGGVEQLNDVKNELPTRHVGWYGPWKVAGGLLYQVWANEPRVIGDLGAEWAEGAGEGLVLLDPASGEVVWRTSLTMYDAWNKPLKQLLDKSSWSSNDAYTLREDKIAPVAEVKDGFAWVPAGGQVVKVDLASGQELWRGPDVGFIGEIGFADGFVATEIGAGRFAWKLDKTKNELVDGSGETKDNGLLVLKDADGSVVAQEESKHALGSQLAHVDTETGRFFLSDGEDLRAYALDGGKLVWEKPLKKLTGEIEFKNALVIDRRVGWISYDPVFLGFYDSAAMETEFVDGKQGLRVHWCGDNTIIVLGPDGPAKVDRDGNVLWTGEWKWDSEKAQMVPMITKSGILFQIDDKLGLIGHADGKLLWSVKVDGEVTLSEDGEYAFVMGKKSIAAFKL